ncbi:ATP-binding protein [Actinomadura rupiterrae]|uniref:ATP-binding protein n=1 Tax=Actinomadura rupiterrae TaxID=559627 RepID=UPI0027E361DD|nr:ATP-binding protein [Actinomadura rupiterrae]MCP2339552.1 anti-sigma regulatory factor (Ser/Thr protein kinase) [Actinomadura rupiterrae]
MEITLDLRLPRDSTSVPAARRLLDASLGVLGVDEPIRGDIELMLTEACTNVIRHAQAGDDFTVRVSILDTRCVIRVIDSGRGIDSRTVATAEEPAALTAESGRGLQIMRALADDVRFRNFPDSGSLVALEKHLIYRQDSLGSRMSLPVWSLGEHPDGHRLRSMNEADDAELQEFATRLYAMARTGRTDELVPYIESGVPVNLSNEKGDTLLMLAAYHGHADTVRALLERGADPERANDRGQRPMAGAVFKKEPEVVRVLLEADADPWAGSPSAVETAKMFGHHDLLSLFEEAAESRASRS